MNSSIPKQFLEVCGTPILFYSIMAFIKYNPAIKVIITLPKPYIDYWKNLITTHKLDVDHILVAGGETRFQSVKNALHYVPENKIVAIHDAVRPFVSLETITNAFNEAMDFHNAIPVVGSIDSVRQITQYQNTAMNRSEVFLVQTPQVFHSSELLQAYSAQEETVFTDDASVYEACFNKIHTIAGNKENSKITTSIDLLMAETMVLSLTDHPSFPHITFFNR
jgi:2-C-methyl-D-erythritol 4-phosphate cytidylyltransferase